MPRFTSDRERRLWLWTLAVVVAIYSTLGLARTLAAQLGDTRLGAGLFVVACFLVLATFLTQGLTTKPRGAQIVVLLGVTTVYLLVFVRMSVPTERSHLIEYGVVALFIHAALTERNRHGGGVPRPAWIAILATITIGTLDECLQHFIPGRVFDPRDVFFNALAAVMAVATVSALRWARGRF